MNVQNANNASNFGGKNQYHSTLKEIEKIPLDIYKVEFHRTINKMNLNRNELFDLLEYVVLYSRNDRVRYLSTQFFFENFPEQSKPTLKLILLRDLNYKIPVKNFSPSERSSVNDIINACIEDKRNREAMIEQIINNDNLRFILYYKDYSDYFVSCYCTNLHCYILLFRLTRHLAYLCRNIDDPFSSVIVLRVESLKSFLQTHSNPYLNLIIRFLTNFLNLGKQNLKIATLKSKRYSDLPQFKVFSPKNDLVIYYSLED